MFFSIYQKVEDKKLRQVNILLFILIKLYNKPRQKHYFHIVESLFLQTLEPV